MADVARGSIVALVLAIAQTVEGGSTAQQLIRWEILPSTRLSVGVLASSSPSPDGRTVIRLEDRWTLFTDKPKKITGRLEGGRSEIQLSVQSSDGSSANLARSVKITACDRDIATRFSTTGNIPALVTCEVTAMPKSPNSGQAAGVLVLTVTD